MVLLVLYLVIGVVCCVIEMKNFKRKYPNEHISLGVELLTWIVIVVSWPLCFKKWEIDG